MMSDNAMPTRRRGSQASAFGGARKGEAGQAAADDKGAAPGTRQPVLKPLRRQTGSTRSDAAPADDAQAPPVTTTTAAAPSRATKPAAMDRQDRAAVNVALSDDEMARMTAHKAATGLSYIDIVIHAVASIVDDPAAAIAAEREREAGTTASLGGFVVARPGRPTQPRRVRIWRTYASNVELIERTAAAGGAANRNELLRAALLHYLERKGI